MNAFEDDAAYLDIPAQTEALLETVRDLADEDLAADSLCPGWTRGHVLTHLARNADAFLRLLTGAAGGEQWAMYRSVQARNDEIEAGATRSAAEMEEDLESSADRLTTAFESFPAEQLGLELRLPNGRAITAGDIAMRRWCELVLHHLDLNVPFDLSTIDAVADRGIADAVERLERTPGAPSLRLTSTTSGASWTVGKGDIDISGSAGELLVWLAGRSDGSALDCQHEGGLPSLPSWG